MTAAKTWRSFALGGILLLAAWPAHAQVSSLGKGWLLDSAGSITSTPAEVISGRNSIKGSYSGPDSEFVKPFLNTNPTFIQFTPNETYTITLSYRIITAGSRGFQFGFSSSTAERQGHFLPTSVITGAAGASGKATLTSKLESYTDVRAGFTVGGTGAITVDDIRITNSAGTVLTSENAEGPTLAPGPLNFQLTDAIALLPDASASALSAKVHDLDGDGHPETILTLVAPNPSNIPLQPMIIESSGQMRLATSDFFPTGIPRVKASPMTLFADINGDGLQDIFFSDAGYDGPGVFPGSRIGVALNLGGGKYRDVSSLIPADQQTTRSYAIAVGDVLGDGRTEIILPDEDDGANTALLRWNGNGFDEIRNWIPSSLWAGGASLHLHGWMVLADMDKDGKQDLLVSGAGWTPNLRIVFGAPGGFTSATSASVLTLPDGPFAPTPVSNNPPPVAQSAEVAPVVVADFNNDGLPDIFATERQYLTYQPGVYTDTNDPNYANIRANGGTVYADAAFQVLLNQGSRKFADVTSASTILNFGRREYQNLMAVDINNDGFLDVVGTYATEIGGPQYGTTVFLNDGTGAFQVVDGVQLLAAVTTTPSNGQRWNLGSFVPTVVNPQRTEGIVYESVGGCGLGFCAATGLNLYKVVANGAIGTGPGFQDSAKLGVPGFNEFYYLRHYADAAAAVQAGQYPNGLAHYLAVGMAKGYLSHAPNPSVPVVPPNSVLNNASFASGATPLAPGTIAAIFGTNLNDGSKNPSSLFGTNGRLLTTLGGASVTFNGVSAPLFSSFPGQLNVQVPFELAGPTSATVVVTVGGHASAPQTVPIGPSSPGIFSINGQGTGQGAIVISATGEFAAPVGSISGSAAQPASRGQYITIYCTGLGNVTNRPATGAAALHDPLSTTTETPTVSIGGVPAKVSFSGLTPDLVGVYQVNVEVPSEAPTGDAVEVVLRIGGVTANTVTIAVK